MTLRIGELARSTRTNPPTIRYYEEIGLLPAPARRPGGQRCYGEEDRRRLTFIRQCREFGFPIEEIRSLVTLTQDSGRSCMEARAIAVDHLASVREKVAELKELECNLADLIQRCDEACAGGPGPDCVMLRDMAEPVRDAKASKGGRKIRRSRQRSSTLAPRSSKLPAVSATGGAAKRPRRPSPNSTRQSAGARVTETL